ncbi:MAG: hypothetical protein HY722_04850 [Planctomycetes bacterium]|nr:hypothetical protein [Planctomycetota bacterium]
MRWALLAVFFLALPAWADEYEEALDDASRGYPAVQGDDSGYLYRAGYRFHPVQTARLGPRQNLLDIRAKLSPPGAGCGAFDFLTNYRYLFNQHAAENYLKSITTNVVAAAPLVVACYASPTLCDAFKHFKTMANLSIDTAYARCDAVQDAVLDWGSNLYNKQKAECLDEKGAQGVPLEEALRACSGVHEIANLSGRKQGEVNLIDDAFDYMKDPDPAHRTLARHVFGDLTVRADGQVFSTRAKGGIRIIYNTTLDEKVDRWQRLLSRVKAGRPVDPTDLRDLSTPALPITEEVVQSVASLAPSKQAVAVSSIASATAMAEVQSRVHQLDEKLAGVQTDAARTNPDLVEQLRTERTRVAEQLENMLREERQSAQLAQTVLSVLREAEGDSVRTLSTLRGSAGSLKRSRHGAGQRGSYGGLTIYRP